MTNDAAAAAAVRLVVASKRRENNEAAQEWEAWLGSDICLEGGDIIRWQNGLQT